MEMKPSEKLKVDLHGWDFGVGGDFEKPIAKLCAEAIENSLIEYPPDLLFDGGDVKHGLYVSVMLPAFSEAMHWECSLTDAVLEKMAGCDDEDRREVAAALRALADAVEAQNEADD